MFNHQKNHKVAHEMWAEDVAQIIFGSCLLAVPVAFTEEVWRIGEVLGGLNIVGIFAFSLIILSVATFHTGYKHKVVTIWDIRYWQKIFASYFIILMTVTLILILINKAPWMTEPIVALKRSIILAFPASLSAVTADLIK